MEVNDDDDADPEYNILEDEEEHDSEEFRRDPAVKVSKKEFNELIAELYDESVQARNKVETSQTTEPQVYPDPIVPETPPKPPPQPVIEDKKEEPLITEFVQGIIKYQLQQHVQLLAQTYVLTAACNEDVVKPLARESKKMIIELHSFALNYGPNSTFKVKNILYAATLVNSWPPNFISKSPIKKKILEERYRNEIIKIPGGSGHTFTREIVKTISESKAFMYPELLPVFPHLNSSLKINFTPSEDALIAIGCREMQDKMYEPLQLMKKAKLISDLLLPGRHRLQIFYRIKNARKHEKNEKVLNCGLQVLRKYLIDGIDPPSPLDSWTTELLEIEPLEPLNQQKLPSQWMSVLKQLKLDILFKDEFVDLEPKKPPRVRKSKSITLSSSDQEEKRPVKKSSKSFSRSEVSYQHSPPISNHPPQVGFSSTCTEELERFPVLDKNGIPAAFIIIPKKFCHTSVPTPLEQDSNNNVNLGTDIGSEITHKKLIVNPTISTSSKGSPASAEKVLDVTPVGLPFSLPCLTENFPGSLLDVQSLESPLKKEIFQKASASDPQSSKSNKKLTNQICGQVSTNKKLLKTNNLVNKTEAPPTTIILSLKETSNKNKCREDHSARTWIYNRKSPDQIAATIEKKLLIKNKSSLRKDISVQFPESSHGEKEPNQSGVSHSSSDSENTEGSDSDSSVPSFFEEKIETPSINMTVDFKTVGDSSWNSAPAESGDQKASDGANTSPNSDTKSKSSTSGGRNPRGAKRDGARQTAGDGDGEDEHNPDRNKRQLSSKVDNIDHQEEETEDDTEEKEAHQNSNISKPSVTKSQGASVKVKTELPLGSATPKTPRRMKRSPGSQTKRRTPKFKSSEIQKLLDDAESEVNIEAIETAFAEEFWAKCQHTVDPVLYNNLIQVFSEFGEKYSSEEEVFIKVEEMLKDYPDLLIDLATMIEPQLLQKNNLLKDNYVVQAYIRFMHLLECPQLRARALQKIRGLRDLEKVTEKDVQELVDLFFQGNPIMTDAVKAMFPNIFPPESAVRPQDFEEINFDDDLPHSEEAMGMEFINFPEEANIPATGSCPCDCHTDPKNVNLHTKARHCRKCCIKFQDGKVFMHSGRLMKQVNIEFTTREKAEEILARRACGHCFEPIKGTPSPKRKLGERTHKKRATKASKIAISDCDSESEFKKSIASAVPSTSKSRPVAVLENEVHISADALPKTKKEPDEDLEEGEIIDEEEHANHTPGVSANINIINPTLTKSEPECLKSHKKVVTASEKKSRNEPQKYQRPWTYDEDKILLVTCQQEQSTTVAFGKIIQKKLLPHRTFDDVKERFSYLVSIIMKSFKNPCTLNSRLELSCDSSRSTSLRPLIAIAISPEWSLDDINSIDIMRLPGISLVIIRVTWFGTSSSYEGRGVDVFLRSWIIMGCYIIIQAFG
ncbi:unnamed protein product [Allacma fusca]|uniref:GON-4-like protein n=1 Tax=Allacma fusca TaxID=39272 RepID=A0A8J2NNH7_9HEXA|nr:unnamed protein product [Allacma fusca]